MSKKPFPCDETANAVQLLQLPNIKASSTINGAPGIACNNQDVLIAVIKEIESIGFNGNCSNNVCTPTKYPSAGQVHPVRNNPTMIYGSSHGSILDPVKGIIISNATRRYIPANSLGLFWIADERYDEKNIPKTGREALDRFVAFSKFDLDLVGYWRQKPREFHGVSYLVLFSLPCKAKFNPFPLGDQCIQNNLSHHAVYSKLRQLIYNTLGHIWDAAASSSNQSDLWEMTKINISQDSAGWNTQTNCYKNRDYLTLQNNLIPQWQKFIPMWDNYIQQSPTWCYIQALTWNELMLGVKSFYEAEMKYIYHPETIAAMLNATSVRIPPFKLPLIPLNYPKKDIIPLHPPTKPWNLTPAWVPARRIIPGKDIIPVGEWWWFYIDEMLDYFDITLTYLENFALVGLPVLGFSYYVNIATIPLVYTIVGLYQKRWTGQLHDWWNHSPTVAKLLEWIFDAQVTIADIEREAKRFLCGFEIFLWSALILVVSSEIGFKFPQALPEVMEVNFGTVIACIGLETLLILPMLPFFKDWFPDPVYDVWRALPSVF